jgi:hypothetical protein
VNKRVPDPEISKTKGGVNPRKPERERERGEKEKKKKKRSLFSGLVIVACCLCSFFLPLKNASIFNSNPSPPSQ